MSYSFNLVADSKAELKAAVAAEFDRIEANQPAHKADRATAQAVCDAFVDVLVDPPAGQVVHISANGSMGWRAEGEYISATIAVSTNIRS